MVSVDESHILIYGGAGLYTDYSDGVLVNTKQRKVDRTVRAGEFIFQAFNNHHFITDSSKVVAIAYCIYSDNKLIEVNVNDYSISVLQDLK